MADPANMPTEAEPEVDWGKLTMPAGTGRQVRKTAPAPAVAPLLVSARDLQRLLSVGKTKLFAMLSAGLLPEPIRLGRSLRWRRDEIARWVAAGCPPAERWRTLSGGRR